MGSMNDKYIFVLLKMSNHYLDCLVEWNDSVIMEQCHQLSFVVGKSMVGLDLKYGVDIDTWRRSS